MTEMPVAAAARKVGEHDTRLWRIFHYYVERAMMEMDMTGVKRIALDETSSRRGHEYVALFVDMDTKRVLLATEGKGSIGLLSFKQFLSQRGIDPNQIGEACCDMSAAFIAGIEEHFPAAQITFDKFHVMKPVNEAVDEVRREEQKEVVELFEIQVCIMKMNIWRTISTSSFSLRALLVRRHFEPDHGRRDCAKCSLYREVFQLFGGF